MKREELINDQYRKARGGHSRLLRITCEECGVMVCLYQKDGPGILKRLYFDRIFNPNYRRDKKNFLCKKGHILGVQTIYEKEKREAFRLFSGAVVKKIIKANE